jgi:4-amino-4-deoxy-L-arabinose transferase-like glycosyltransferase
MSKIHKLIRHPLTWIILGATIIRLWQVGAADVITDEVFYALRGLGYLDYDVGLTQTSPIQWLDSRPWWSWLSFHDHPPLIFLINYLFLKIGGMSTWVIRLPSVIAGVGSVAFVYRIGLLKNRRVAVISALILACSTYHIWISRIGLQESVVIFLMLVTSYYYLVWAHKHGTINRWGSYLGLLWLTKFTGFILVPVIGSHQWLLGRFRQHRQKLFRALLLSVVIFSPVVVYNLVLQIQFGHLDFQFSYLFGQHPAIWSTHKGKDLGSVADKLHLLGYNLFTGENILLAVSMALAGLGSLIRVIYQRWRSRTVDIVESFVALTLFWLVIFLAGIGGTERFTSLLIPFFCLSVALVLDAWLGRRSIQVSITIVLICSLATAVNSFILQRPAFSVFGFVSSLRVNSASWGYNQLDQYIQKELEGKKPRLTFPTRYSWLETLRNQALASDYQAAPILIVYDHRLDQSAALWYLHRRLIYNAWPIIPDSNFLEESQGNFGYWHDMGFDTIYIIHGEDTLYDPAQSEEVTLTLSTTIPTQLVESHEIVTPDGQKRFTVTKIVY